MMLTFLPILRLTKLILNLSSVFEAKGTGRFWQWNNKQMKSMILLLYMSMDQKKGEGTNSTGPVE